MTACPRCAARYAGAPETERQWIERHKARHGGIRVATMRDEPGETRRTTEPQAA